jgi:peptidoglycan/xylan/chitin deacetylase (PgdA/CDA1 family)
MGCTIQYCLKPARMVAILFWLSFWVANPVVAHALDSGWDHKPRVLHVPILMYHYVSQPPADADKVLKDLAVLPEDFEKQVNWLKEQDYKTISPDDLIAALWQGKPLPPKPILLTFDDGYWDAYAIVYPILKAAGYTGTFFVVTDWVDAARKGYLNWDMAREMVQGGMYIESHSRTHLDFRNRDHAWYIDQIGGSIKAIETHTGVRPRYFCYPFGGYDDVAIRELRAAGIVAAFTENDSRYEYAANTMRLPRIRIRGAMTLTQFAAAVKDEH